MQPVRNKTVNFSEQAFEQSLRPSKLVRKPTRGEAMALQSKPDGSQRMRKLVLKQQSSYLSDFECDSDEMDQQYEERVIARKKAAAREAFEVEKFVGTVELDGNASSDETSE